MDILNNFGVQPILLLAQVVNFLILLFLLKKFLYAPILKVLQDRKDRITQGLKDAENAQKKLEEARIEVEKMLEKAALESKKSIEQTNLMREEILKEAKEEAAKLVAAAQGTIQEQINSEREKMQQELRDEFAKILTLSLEKVSGKILTRDDQRALIDKSIKDIK